MAKVTFLTFYNDISIGVSVLAGVLHNAGHDVTNIFFKLPAIKPAKWFKDAPIYGEMIDHYGQILSMSADLEKWTDDEVDLLTGLLDDLSPDVLCVSCRSFDNFLVSEVLPKIRSKCDAYVLAGGYGPTLEPEFYADFVDWVFIGEAENCIIELIEKLIKTGSLDSFGNIAYKRNGHFVRNKLIPPDNTGFSFIDYDVPSFAIDNNQIYNHDERMDLIHSYKYPTFVGRGCIGNCSYCSAGQWSKVYSNEGFRIKIRRNRRVEDVIEELTGIKDKGYTFILFKDEFLAGDTDYLKRLFREYERHISIPFFAHLVPNQILAHPELLSLAIDAGFVTTEIGWQAGSERICRDIFTRKVTTKSMLAYVDILARNKINMKHDFILFNPAETKEDYNESFRLIQRIPKDRGYLLISRLMYFPFAPISRLLQKYATNERSFEYYYSMALLYLICYVLPPDDFWRLLRNSAMTSSWQRLLKFYQTYLKEHNISFQAGTHKIPGSITTHRYERILQKRNYTDVIVWGAGDYYEEIAPILESINIRYHIDDGENTIGPNKNIFPPDILSNIKEPLPIFICSSRKQEIKMKIINGYPFFAGKIIV